MTRFEEMLLERMTVRRWCVAVAAGAVLFGTAGYFTGREHVKAQVQTGAAGVVAELDRLEAWGKRYSAEQKAKDERFKSSLREGGK